MAWGGGLCICVAIWKVRRETGHNSARREAFSEDEMVWRMSPVWPSRTCLPVLSVGVGWGREGKRQIVKQYACEESSKTVRLSDVLLDSGKFIFSLFSVFSRFSIMNMYFLNQKNKKSF